VKDRESCARGWCGGESVLGCEQGEDGLYRPQFSGFLVSRDLFESALESRSVPAHIDETALQPIYGVADRSLYDKAPDDGALQAGGYGGGRYSTSDQHLQTAFEWYYFMSNGRYLGTVRTKDSVV